MKRFLSVVAVFSLTGLLSAQQTPSTQTDASAQQQQQVDTQEMRSVQSFEGLIAKSGDKLVLQVPATQASYQLDDQIKAKQYEGKGVKVIATMNPNTNTLHIIDIVPSESR
jgi:hypothetical protein